MCLCTSVRVTEWETPRKREIFNEYFGVRRSGAFQDERERERVQQCICVCTRLLVCLFAYVRVRKT